MGRSSSFAQLEFELDPDPHSNRHALPQPWSETPSRSRRPGHVVQTVPVERTDDCNVRHPSVRQNDCGHDNGALNFSSQRVRRVLRLRVEDDDRARDILANVVDNDGAITVASIVARPTDWGSVDWGSADCLLDRFALDEACESRPKRIDSVGDRSRRLGMGSQGVGANESDKSQRRDCHPGEEREGLKLAVMVASVLSELRRLTLRAMVDTVLPAAAHAANSPHSRRHFQ